MNDHATLLREAATAVRPMIEDDIDKREIYAAWRRKFSDAGLDWMAFKSLQKARVEDDRDESGDGKRVAKIMDRLDCTAAYAEMLGYGSAKMNENNCFSVSYSEAKGRGTTGKFAVVQSVGNSEELSATPKASVSKASSAETGDLGTTSFDPETGEITNEPEAAAEVAGDYLREPVAAEQGQIIREGDAPRETDRLCGDASCPDAEYSHSQATSSQPADTAEEVNLSSRTSSATHSDDIDLTIPDFLRRTEGGYPKRESVEA